MYTTLPADADAKSKTEKFVSHLMMPLLNKGCQLYCGKFCTLLFINLDSHSTGCCGMMYANWVPQTVRKASVGNGVSDIQKWKFAVPEIQRQMRGLHRLLQNLHNKKSTTRKWVRGWHESYIDRPDDIKYTTDSCAEWTWLIRRNLHTMQCVKLSNGTRNSYS